MMFNDFTLWIPMASNTLWDRTFFFSVQTPSQKIVILRSRVTLR
jgi:hypothetical protein